MTKTVGILGGGITGVILQRFLDCDSTILEASDRIGGLCKTHDFNGFKFDVGGHIANSRHVSINAFIESQLGDNIVYKDMDTKKILYKNKLIKYPFYEGLGDLAPKEAGECIKDFIDFEGRKIAWEFKDKSIKDYFYCNFGKAISDKNLIPYTNKLWKWPCDQMVCDWMDRIPGTNLESLIDSAFRIKKEKELRFFKYPKEGGFEAIVKAVAKKDANIKCNSNIISIKRTGYHWDKESRWHVVCESGFRGFFDEIVVTFPIHEIAKYLGYIPTEVYKALECLKHNSLRVICFSIDYEKHLAGYYRTWNDNCPRYDDENIEAIYIADPKILPHRVCYPRYFSESMVPEGKHSLMAEVTTMPDDMIHGLNDGELIERVASNLVCCGLMNPESIIDANVIRCKYAYPIYTLDYNKNIKIVKDYFKSLGIHLCGRFAEFEYINSDECMFRAITLANQLNSLN